MQDNDSSLDVAFDNSASIAAMRVIVDERQIAIFARRVRNLEEGNLSASDGGQESTDDVASVLLSSGEVNASKGKN